MVRTYKFQDKVLVEVHPGIWRPAHCVGATHYDYRPDGLPKAIFAFGEHVPDWSTGKDTYFFEGKYRTVLFEDDIKPYPLAEPERPAAAERDEN